MSDLKNQLGRNVRESLDRVLQVQSGNPALMLEDLMALFEEYAAGGNFDETVSRAYADAAVHLGNAVREFSRRGL